MIEQEGWYLVVTKGSHRLYKHPDKPGRVTISGHPSEDISPGTLMSIKKQAGLKEYEIMYKFLIVIEKAGGKFSAYAPDLPGCVATGQTREETEERMMEAIELHIHKMLEDSLPIPRQEAYASVFAIPEHR